jgi:hypothetical protein
LCLLSLLLETENTGVFGPTEGKFIMQVVDNQAISVILIEFIIPVPRNKIYRGTLGLLREIL